MQVLTEPGHVQIIGLIISVVTLGATAINVFVGLRLAAMQSKLKADAASLEVTFMKQFVAWKDEVLATINGKYVSAQLIAEIRTSMGREMAQMEMRLDRIEKRCEERPKECMALRCHVQD